MSDKRSERIPLNTNAIKNDLEKYTPRRKVSNTSPNEGVARDDTKPREKQDIKAIPNKKNQEIEKIIEEKSVVRGFDVPEYILIVFDRIKDEIETDFFDCGDKKLDPRNVMARVLRMFIHNKLAISYKHSFSIMTLNERDATLVLPKFTKTTQMLEKALQKQIEGCNTEDIFNLNIVFETILAKHNALIHYDKSPPDVVYRVIFCYGRSFTVPILNETPEIRALLEAPNFFFDVVYTHESPLTTESNYDNIFKLLRGIDKKHDGYLFQIERNLKAAHMAMASLLAHPLQRTPLKSSFPSVPAKANVPRPIIKEEENEDGEK